MSTGNSERAEPRTNFSDSLVVIISNQYQAPRTVATRVSALPAGGPDRGIAAGCWAATLVVQQYCVSPLDIWVTQNPRVEPMIFIDKFLVAGHSSKPNIDSRPCHGLSWYAPGDRS